ncbi:MAG: hypothetical protein RR561_00940 [Peptostreptococcus sp.]|uniref:hypothetical protein n=1 Tax=Peptostreptococcus sp. TaxID=1262 RepID=UPI002FC96461
MNFKKSFCTNTRLMGTMMLLIEWVIDNKIISHIFMLDAEGLGISDFYRMEDASEHERESFYRQKYGGLGGVNISMNEEEACFLVYEYMNKNIRYEKSLPDSFSEDIKNKYSELYNKLNILQDDQDNEELESDLEYKNKNIDKKHSDEDKESSGRILYRDIKKTVFKKICKRVETDNEFVNYMIMRLVARDRESLLYYSGNEDVADLHITNINGALLYNEIEKKKDDKFVCNCVYEDSDGYYEAKVVVMIDKEIDDDEEDIIHENEKMKYSLRSFMIMHTNAIYDFEVFDIISKEETIDIYNIKDTSKENKEIIENKIYNAYPAIQGIQFDCGSLYIQYYFDNTHLDSDIYVINNDIMFIIYLNKDRLFLATYNERSRELIEESLSNELNKLVDKENIYKFEQNVLFDFVESGNDDFYDFID